MTTHTASVESVGRGIGSMLGAVLFYTIADTATRWLGLAGFESPQIVFFRYLIGLLPVAVMVWISGAGALRTRRPAAHERQDTDHYPHDQTVGPGTARQP